MSKIVTLFLIIFLGSNSWALDPQKAITQYVHDVWQIEDGLPQNTITAILQTRDGYIWLGTQEGLVRFDGVRFTVFDKRNTEEIKNSHILTLFEDHEGSLWIGTYGGGLNRLRDEKFTAYTTKEGLSSDHVRSIYEDREGSLWIGTYGGGLNRLKDGGFTAYTTKEGLSNDFVRSIYEDKEGSLWIGTDGGGLNKLRDGKFTVYTTKEGLSNDHVKSLYEDREGSLWIGTGGGGLNQLKDGKFTVYTTKEGLSNDFVRPICEDREGSLWIGTYGGGLNRLKDGKFTAYTTKEGLSNDMVWSIYEDREGSLWIGTDGGGLNRLRDGKFTVYTTEEGLSNDMVRSICEDREGSLWISTDDGGLNRLRDEKFTVYTTKEGLSNNMVGSICEDREGNLWIGTDGGGLNRLKDGKFTAYTTKEGLSNDFVWSLYEDREGSLWIGTWSGGLNRLKDGKFTVYTTEEGLSNDFVRSIYKDREGNLWIGTDGGGLNRLRDGKFTVYTTKEGLSSDLVRTLYEDREGSLWIGTRGGGLNRLKDGKFIAYTTKEGLLDDSVWQILEDGKENLWMSCNKGIFRVSKRELNDFADGKISSINSISYGKQDGMKSSECNGGIQPAGWKSRDGKLWFPTIRGVVMIDPENIRTNKLPPPVLIEQVIIDNRSFVASGVIQLTPGNKDFEFRYTGLSFLVPERVKFKYKLEGWNKEWIDAGTRRTAYYTNIPPGSYSFRVIACNNDGIWNEEGTSLKIIVPPLFWQTWWFRVSGLIVILFLIALVYEVRTHNIKKKSKQLEYLVEERTDELKSINQQLEETNKELESFSYSVSHDLRAPLRAIDGFTRILMEDYVEKLDAEGKRLGSVIQKNSKKMGQLIDDLLAFSRMGRAAMRISEIDMGNMVNAIYHEATNTEERKRIKFTIADLSKVEGDTNMMRQVWINLISNAIKFSFQRKQAVISVTCKEEEDKLTYCIKDNGVGFNMKYVDKLFGVFQRLHSEKEFEGTGVGLALVQRIIHRHGGEVWAEGEVDKGAAFYFSLPKNRRTLK